MSWLVRDQLILDELDSARTFWTKNDFAFDEPVGFPVRRTDFSQSSFTVLDTT